MDKTILLKSAVAAVAIVVALVLALAKSIAGPDAVDFIKWILGFWMGAIAITQGAGAIATAIAAKSPAIVNVSKE